MTSHFDSLVVKANGGSACGAKEITEIYDAWADQYDQFFVVDKKLNKPDPGIVAMELAAIQGIQKDCRVLDVAAGTGLVGDELKALGFTNVDGLDASQTMLDIAQKRGVYKNVYSRWFTAEPTQGLEEASYDVLATTGSFVRKHLDPSCLVEFLRLTKTGGSVVVGINSEGDMNIIDEFVAALDTLVGSGKCSVTKKTYYEKFNHEFTPGYVYILQKI